MVTFFVSNVLFGAVLGLQEIWEETTEFPLIPSPPDPDIVSPTITILP